MGHFTVQEEIDSLIRSVALDLDYLVYESAIYLKRDKSRITVKIDSLKGISHADCESFSRELGIRLDKKDILPNYSLEISSPGITRKLRSIEEFTRFIGSPAKVIFEADGARSIFKGTIKNVIDTIIELKSDKEEVKVEFKNIIRANLEF
ncbi:MAG: hypothetical protein MUC95_06035 [Spirochaetes bacterium]|jgi:ribosome maturation factor RimP|nr:hypothetical protein [Spirochaetota bacterium]